MIGVHIQDERVIYACNSIKAQSGVCIRSGGAVRMVQVKSQLSQHPPNITSHRKIKYPSHWFRFYFWIQEWHSLPMKGGNENDLSDNTGHPNISQKCIDGLRSLLAMDKRDFNDLCEAPILVLLSFS